MNPKVKNLEILQFLAGKVGNPLLDPDRTRPLAAVSDC